MNLIDILTLVAVAIFVSLIAIISLSGPVEGENERDDEEEKN